MTAARNPLRTRTAGGASRRPAVALALLVALGAVGIILARNIDVLDLVAAHRASLLAWCESHWLPAIALYVATYVMVIVFSLPGAFAMAVTGGFLFGLVPGAALSVLGATAGGLLVFLAVRHGVGDALRTWLLARDERGLFHRVEQGIRENAVAYMLLLRLLPAVPFTVSNVAPAFFGVRTRTFVLTTFFGVMPASTVTAWIGAGLGEVFDRGERPDLGLLAEPQVFGPLLGLAALAGLPLMLRRFLGARLWVSRGGRPSPGSRRR